MTVCRSDEPEYSRSLPGPAVLVVVLFGVAMVVMTLAIASHAAKLLPLAVPKADERTEVVDVSKAALVSISATNTFSFDGSAALTMDDLSARLAELPAGQIVLVSASPKAKYESLVKVVDRLLEHKDLRVAFGHLSGAIAATKPPVDGGN